MDERYPQIFITLEIFNKHSVIYPLVLVLNIWNLTAVNLIDMYSNIFVPRTSTHVKKILFIQNIIPC
jgi:hypothetical protein